jgi:hypothetical protein
MLTALVLAAGAAAYHPPVALTAGDMPNIYQAPAHCQDRPYQVVDRFGRPVPIRLADLPKAGAQLLVDRQVNGCRVITLMSGKVSPQTDQPNPPASQYRIIPAKPR